jgi:hypothetical protein
VDPKARQQARSAALKASDEYTKSVAAARDLDTFISLARAGNKEAHAYLSPEGVLTLNTGRGVTRVNRQEIEAYGEAGSLLDRLSGKLGKWTTGQSIPKDILNDIESLHKAIADNASKNYDAKLNNVNSVYRSDFKPTTKLDTAESVGGHKIGDSVTYNGKQYKVKGFNNGKLVLE